MSTLYIRYWVEDEDFYFSATDHDEFDETFVVEGEASAIDDLFTKVYTIINDRKSNRESTLLKSLATLSEYFIEPIADQIEASDFIRFLVPGSLIRYPFDLLVFNEDFLFLQRKIAFQVAEGAVNDEPELELSSAFFSADLTADPEEACYSLIEKFDEYRYVSNEKSSIELYEEYAPESHVIVISAHGEVDDDNDGYIEINGENLTEEHIAQGNQWILYLDSCQQGINMSFLTAFQEESQTEFYVAPITSNDAGDSSTKTMQWFFEQVLKHGDPFKALEYTRKRLYKHYSKTEELDLVETLAKAAVFRVYERATEE